MSFEDIFGDGNPFKDAEADRQRIFDKTGMRVFDALPTTNDNLTWTPLEFKQCDPIG
jgi:hypothetical protein